MVPVCDAFGDRESLANIRALVNMVVNIRISGRNAPRFGSEILAEGKLGSVWLQKRLQNVPWDRIPDIQHHRVCWCGASQVIQ